MMELCLSIWGAVASLQWSTRAVKSEAIPPVWTLASWPRLGPLLCPSSWVLAWTLIQVYQKGDCTSCLAGLNETFPAGDAIWDKSELKEALALEKDREDPWARVS